MQVLQILLIHLYEQTLRYKYRNAKKNGAIDHGFFTKEICFVNLINHDKTYH